jgi:hypothetical protein
VEFAGLFYILVFEENGLRRQSELKARVSSGEGSEKSKQLFAVFCGEVLRLSHSNRNGEVDWKKVDRAPLLLIGGGNDHIVPPVVPTTVLEKCSHGGDGLVEYKQFEGRTHHIVGQKAEEHLK